MIATIQCKGTAAGPPRGWHAVLAQPGAQSTIDPTADGADVPGAPWAANTLASPMQCCGLCAAWVSGFHWHILALWRVLSTAAALPV